MSPAPTAKPIGLTELIYQVKKELLSSESRRGDPVPLFAVEEIQNRGRRLSKPRG
jgi:hypothetical protein